MSSATSPAPGPAPHGAAAVGMPDGPTLPVTGEAVALDLPSAGLGTRAISGLLDMMANWFVANLLSTTTLLAAQRLDPAATAGLGVLVVVLSLVVFPTVLEGLTGRTLGKFATGLRTVRHDAGPIRLRHALTRHLIGLVEVYGFAAIPALLCGIFSPSGGRLGDLAAGTRVVRERVRTPRPRVGVVAPQLQGWAATADLAPLPDDLAIAVRELLTRAPQMRPEARADLAQRFARQVTTYVAPPPPAGTPPEVFLEAVLVERGRRDWNRLQHEEALRAHLLTPRGARLRA